VFLYVTEIIVNVVTYGFIMTPGTYLRRSNWNVLHFVITLVNVLQVILNTDNFIMNFIDSLRVLVFIKLGAEHNRSIQYA
jgi:hypothetical protein